MLLAGLLSQKHMLRWLVMVEDVRVRFGRRLRNLRLKRGWTQVQLAKRLGMDRSYLGDVERGKRNISSVKLDMIARGFGLSMAQLFARV